MAYNDLFYKLYKDYLVEPTVRQAHDWIFRIAKLDNRFDRVVDLGCGEFNEYHQYAKPSQYVGIDINVEASRLVWKYNYRDIRWIDKISCDITGFVSLFSSEITATSNENYAFYRNIFKHSSLQVALVSGFYYAKKKNENPICEAGDVLSFQTVDFPEEVSQIEFSEKRIILPVPSKLFGDDVYEVWKFFERIPKTL